MQVGIKTGIQMKNSKVEIQTPNSNFRFILTHSLSEREQQREVAVHAVLLLQFAGGHNALPGGRELDQDALLANAFLLVQANDLQSSLHLSILIETQSGVDLGGDCGERRKRLVS